MNTDFEERLVKEKAEKHRGVAKIWLFNLRPEDEGINPRQTEPKNVTRLLNMYRIGGCHRLKPQHHVPVLINDEQVHRLKSPSNSKPEFLEVEDQVQLVYLHGHHRLQAARLHLPPPDAWWIADLYSEDLSEDNKRIIREEYLGASNFCDGDIFRHLRRCRLSNNPGEKTWLARLSESKRSDILQLEKAADKDRQMRKFRDSLDALLPFAGLWRALHIGAFHRLLPLHCPEELTCYLTKVKVTWAYICDSNQSIQSQLDADTVEKLQGRCPYLSQNDCSEVEAGMNHRKLFPLISSEDVRAAILARLRTIKYLIPTIHTFLEDTKYLEPCVQIMRDILPQSYRGTIQEGFSQLHNGQTMFPEQRSEADFTETQYPTARVHWMSYRQLWLFAFRHFPEMTGYTPRKDVGRPRPATPGIEHSWWHHLASLAERSGYMNVRKLFPASADADIRMTQAFLHQARPSQYYHFDEGVFDSEVLRICSVLRKAQARQSMSEQPSLASDRESGCGRDILSRCGRPYEKSFVADRVSMFYSNIYRKYEDTSPKRFLSSFAVKRAIFHHFFGGIEDCPRLLRRMSTDDVISSDHAPDITTGIEGSSVPTSEASQTSSDLPQLPDLPTPGDERQSSIMASSSDLTHHRSSGKGILILRPSSPIHWGSFDSDFVRWDEPEQLRSSLDVAAKTSILMLPDRAQRLKCVAAANLTQGNPLIHNVVIKAPRNKVAEIKSKYEKLSPHTLQAIYTGAIHRLPSNK